MEKQRPLKVFRNGMIAASVWARSGNRGPYGEFTLSRTYRDGGAFKYAATYRVRDAESLRAVISDAVRWMESEEAGFAKSAEHAGTDSGDGETATNGGGYNAEHEQPIEAA